MPKTTHQQLADGSQFHSFVQRRPLYAYLDPQTTPTDVMEQALPPVVYPSGVGTFHARPLTNDEKQSMRKDFEEGTWTYRGLAEKYQCAINQAANVIKNRTGAMGRYTKRSTNWKWWYAKRYAPARERFTFRGCQGVHRISDQ